MRSREIKIGQRVRSRPTALLSFLADREGVIVGKPDGQDQIALVAFEGVTFTIHGARFSTPDEGGWRMWNYELDLIREGEPHDRQRNG